MDKSTLFSLIKGKKAILPIILLALGVLLLILSTTAHGTSEDEEITLEEYKEMLEEELGDLCSQVEGVGKCRVFVTLERGEQKVYKGSSVTETRPPRVMGVSIVCRGSESDRVRMELVNMICALFDIGSNRVAILKLNS